MYSELEISTAINGSLEQSTTMKIWQKTPYLREEENSTTGGITTSRTFIKRPEGIYRYDATLKTYQSDPQIVISQPFTADMVNDLLKNQTITILGAETIDGNTTTVIQYTPIQAGNSTTITIWVWNEKGVPLKTRSITKNQGITKTIDSTYKNYSFSVISDSTFSVE